MDNPQKATVVVVVPLPAQGHLNQLLHFSLHLSTHYPTLQLHFASSTTHNRQAQHRIQGWNSSSLQTIHFHDLPLPSFPTPPPDPNAAHKFPNQLIPLFEASQLLQSPLSSLLLSLSSTSRRLIVIHDPLMSFAGNVASTVDNAESYSFNCLPAFYNLSLLWDTERVPLLPKQEVLLDVIATPLEDCYTQEFLEFISGQNFDVPNEAGSLMNTCRAIEGEFVDLLAQLPSFSNKKLFAVGPINPVTVDNVNNNQRHDCLEWLDKQPPASVVYVSFGSTSAISDKEIQTLAAGLQCSGQRFIWVLRDADRGNIFDGSGSTLQRELPAGFEENVDGLGIVVRGWAPQLEILAHKSTGGFVSHCGWNSCMESLSMGVPIIAWPMHSDQPGNALMVMEYLKVGVNVKEWGKRKEELISSSEVEEAIKKVMVYDEGKEIRKRAEALGEAVRAAVAEGGSSRIELDSFVAHITR